MHDCPVEIGGVGPSISSHDYIADAPLIPDDTDPVMPGCVTPMCDPVTPRDDALMIRDSVAPAVWGDAGPRSGYHLTA